MSSTVWSNERASSDLTYDQPPCPLLSGPMRGPRLTLTYDQPPCPPLSGPMRGPRQNIQGRAAGFLDQHSEQIRHRDRQIEQSDFSISTLNK
jgi:hypothetical protein